MELVCIVCPRGCRMTVETDDTVKGSACRKGVDFAMAEKACPMRTVCSTVATSFKEMPVLPVRTNGEIQKAKIAEFMKFVNTLFVNKPVKRGDVIAKNVVGTGVDLIATATIYQ